MKIHIKNGRLIDPKNHIDARQDVFIAERRIVAIGKRPEGFVAALEIDAEGLMVMPGLVDLAARLREPGYEYRATLESEMNAAVAGGVTSLACPPDTDPPLDEPALVEMLKRRARVLNQCRVFPIGALTTGLKGVELTEMIELTEAGCKAFSQADAPLTDTRVLMRAMQYAATFGYRVWLRPQDSFLAKTGVAHDGEVASRLGLPPIPVVAETIALATALQLAKETGVTLHICRISSAAGVEMLRAAKREGLAVTCDVSMNHVHLTEMDIGYFDANCRLLPPLRSGRDRAALLAGLLDGTIDAICSNHSPVDDDAKQLPFDEAEAGATGLELLLPLVLKWAQQQRVPLLDALARITLNPAQLLGQKMGHLSVGAHADICIFDPQSSWVVAPAALKSQGKNTPFNGYEMQGRVRYTLLDGQIVYQA
ncbi:MAG: dihydroorotase [Gallionellales bacterium CG03_land_8_20_14_0_80_55_15]|nr:MAG: dihydroorotase [Gallionellales bacterium CG03_land_8_20_14_0_80_55_15]PJC03533.1 MAG: dihydroorotase [Gallionellales bacterium CG_4_9_14_0_8_um_filter_55_61]